MERHFHSRILRKITNSIFINTIKKYKQEYTLLQELNDNEKYYQTFTSINHYINKLINFDTNIMLLQQIRNINKNILKYFNTHKDQQYQITTFTTCAEYINDILKILFDTKYHNNNQLDNEINQTLEKLCTMYESLYQQLINQQLDTYNVKLKVANQLADEFIKYQSLKD